MGNRSIVTSAGGEAQRTTLLGLVQVLARQGHSELQVAKTALELVESGRVILIGSFRGIPLRSPPPVGDRSRAACDRERLR